jgi:hypothetical protein
MRRKMVSFREQKCLHGIMTMLLVPAFKGSLPGAAF